MSLWHEPKTPQSSLEKVSYFSHGQGRKKLLQQFLSAELDKQFVSTTAKYAGRENYLISFPYAYRDGNASVGTSSKSLQYSCMDKAKLWPASEMSTWMLMRCSPWRAELTELYHEEPSPISPV